MLACLSSRQHASVSQGRICSKRLTCCHTEIGVADPTFYLTQSQYTDTGPASPNSDPVTPGPWQGSHWSAKTLRRWYDWTRNNPHGASWKRTPADALKAQLRAPGNKPARGKVLFTYLSPLRMERVGRAGALVCLAAPSNQRWSDPPPGRRKLNERMP